MAEEQDQEDAWDTNFEEEKKSAGSDGDWTGFGDEPETAQQQT